MHCAFIVYIVNYSHIHVYLNANYAHKEDIMNHNFPCTPEGGKISQLNPIIDYNKSILGGIYITIIPITYNQ